MSIPNLPSSVDSGSQATVTTAGNEAATAHTTFCDATAGGFARTLPTPVGNGGLRMTLDAIHTNANLVIVATAAGAIDGAATVTIGPVISGAPYKCIDVRSDNVIWRIV